MATLLVGPVETYTTIQAAVTAAYAGDIVSVKGGTYREQVIPARSGTSGSRITIQAFDNTDRPIIKGSDIVTTWTLHSGSIWKKTGISVAVQQVFANGALMELIGDYTGRAPTSGGYTVYTTIGTVLADMVVNSFFWETGTNTLYVWAPGSVDPNTLTMEVSLRHSVFKLDNHSYIDLKYLNVRHNASLATSQGAAGIILGNNCRAYNCNASWCDFAGIAFGYSRSNAEAHDCVVSYNGCMGMSGDLHSAFIADACVISRNNTRRFSYTWISAGIKLTTDCYGTVSNCHIFSNDGVGVWWDYCDAGSLCTVSGNYLHDNTQGIMFEGSKNGAITSNRLCREVNRGIYISASDDVTVSGNVLEGVVTLAGIDVSGMPRTGKTLTNVAITTNRIFKCAGNRDVLISAANGTTILTISCNYNTIVRATACVMWYGTPGTWVGTDYSTVAAFQSASGHLGNRYFAP